MEYRTSPARELLFVAIIAYLMINPLGKFDKALLINFYYSRLFRKSIKHIEFFLFIGKIGPNFTCCTAHAATANDATQRNTRALFKVAKV